jgi:hypothetical protein
MGYQPEEQDKRELFTYKVIESLIVVYKYVWAYTWEEGAQQLESQGLELVD